VSRFVRVEYLVPCGEAAEAGMTTWRMILTLKVKILRDEPRVRLANQVNLVSALGVALLLLPEEFTEYDLYVTIAGLSYMGNKFSCLLTSH
jgi:hypothetical protein